MLVTGVGLMNASGNMTSNCFNDALGPLVSDQEGDYSDGSFDTPNAEDEPRGLSDYVGNAGYHPDHTPVDVFMDSQDVGLSVGFAMIADGDDSYA